MLEKIISAWPVLLVLAILVIWKWLSNKSKKNHDNSSSDRVRVTIGSSAAGESIKQREADYLEGHPGSRYRPK